MMRPRVGQLHQSGATDRQVLTWDDGSGAWVPDAPSFAAVCRGSLVATGGESVIELGVVPVANSEAVYVNGHRLAWGGVGYTLTGSMVALASPLTGGDRVLVEYFTTTACGVAVLTFVPTGFVRPVAVTRPVRRYHRIR